MKNELKKLLSAYNIEIEGKDAYLEFDTPKSILHIKDAFYIIGKILHENLEECFFIALVSAGVMNANQAIIIVKFQDQRVYAYAFAKEGIFNQHTAQKAVERLQGELD